MLLTAWENEQAIIEKKEKEVSYVNGGFGREQQVLATPCIMEEGGKVLILALLVLNGGHDPRVNAG